MLNNINLQGRETAAVNYQKGFTILELIIAMIIFLIVTGAAYGVLLVAGRGRTTVSQGTQLNKNVRLALNLVGRDTFNAGFDYPLKNSVFLPDDRIATLLGVPPDSGTASDSIPPIIAGNDINLDTFAVPNTQTDQVTFLFKDSTFNIVGTVGPPDTRFSKSLNISAINTTGSPNQATISGPNGTTGTNAACSVNDLVIITGSGGSALGVITAKVDPNIVQFAAGDVLGFNQNGASSPIRTLTPSYSMQRVTMVTYFVTADGVLTRRDYANSSTVTAAQGWTDNPLVYGVEDFQIQYILNNGTVSNNPGGGTDPSQLSLVRQINFTVKAKTTELNQAGQPYRVTMTTTFSTRNMGYDVN